MSLISPTIPAHYLSSRSLLIQYIWSCPDNKSGMLRTWLCVGLVKVKKSIVIEARDCKKRWGTPDMKLVKCCHGELDFRYLPKSSPTVMGKLLKPGFSHLITTWTVCIFSSRIWSDYDSWFPEVLAQTEPPELTEHVDKRRILGTYQVLHNSRDYEKSASMKLK